MYEPNRAEVRNYLDLRDWLRVDADDRELYSMTKRRLGRLQWTDMNHYADAKTDIVLEILSRAEGWRASGSTPTRKPVR